MDCGTGIVPRRLAPPGPSPGCRLTYGWARMAAVRLPGAVVLAGSRALPLPDVVFDVVTSGCLLHLLDRPEGVRAMVAECARVLTVPED